MGSDINLLVTVLHESQGGLLRCGLKCPRGRLPEGATEYPMETANRQAIHDLLPLHVRNCGPVVDVETLFEIAVVEG